MAGIIKAHLRTLLFTPRCHHDLASVYRLINVSLWLCFDCVMLGLICMRKTVQRWGDVSTLHYWVRRNWRCRGGCGGVTCCAWCMKPLECRLISSFACMDCLFVYLFVCVYVCLSNEAMLEHLLRHFKPLGSQYIHICPANNCFFAAISQGPSRILHGGLSEPNLPSSSAKLLLSCKETNVTSKDFISVLLCSVSFKSLSC